MKKLKILFLSSEVAPFAKHGGLADVSIALSQALKELGHEIRIIMPKYKVINDRRYVLREVIRLKEIPIKIGDSEKKFNVKSAFTPDPIKIQTYFIDYKPYFGREGLYADAKTNKDYPDNDERFTLFAKGVIETLRHLFWQPDIIHCNDWQTGLVPLLLKSIYKDDEFFKKTATIFTVHTIDKKGNFPASTLQKTNVDGISMDAGSPVENEGKFSFLQSGVYFSDCVTTVSEHYSQAIQSSGEYGLGFEKAFRSRRKVLSGIPYGIDYAVWNPETDEMLPAQFTSTNLAGKTANKEALAKKFKLSYGEGNPVIGILSSVTAEKGFDILEEAFSRLLKLNVQFVVMGTGEKKYQTFLRKRAKDHPGKIGVNFSEDEELSHLVIAGSDMLLQPSRIDPRATNQLCGLKYGTVPIVRNTGGLADTIDDFDEDSGTGNGFVFEDYNAKSLLAAVNRAVTLFQNRKLWKKIMKTGMRQDFSWKNTAKKYSKSYEKILNR